MGYFFGLFKMIFIRFKYRKFEITDCTIFMIFVQMIIIFRITNKALMMVFKFYY